MWQFEQSVDVRDCWHHQAGARGTASAWRWTVNPDVDPANGKARRRTGDNEQDLEAKTLTLDDDSWAAETTRIARRMTDKAACWRTDISSIFRALCVPQE
jgi:hypothetical protein